MQFFFADDARQNNPSRAGMRGPIIAIGGVSVPAEAVRGLENDLNDLCGDYGFPSRDEFKWSPGKDLWMRDHLIEEDREAFFLAALELVAASNGAAIVMIEDASYDTATDAPSAELDVTRLFLERVQLMLSRTDTDGVIITDRPGGGRTSENEFLLDC